MSTKKGLSGLVNFGNTCYLNSTIQCLTNTPPFRKLIMSIKTDNKLLISIKNLMTGLWVENCIISPKTFVKTLIQTFNEKNIEFYVLKQNDVHEFISLLLDFIHNSMITNKRFKSLRNLDGIEKQGHKEWVNFFKDDYSNIIDIFYGQIYTVIKDNETIYSRVFQPICFFILPLYNTSSSLNDCIYSYLLKEFLPDYKTDNGDIKNVYKQIIIHKLPRILCFTLNRFNNNNTKINTNIDIPEILDMFEYTKINSKYELYSICNHYGDVHGGHYTALCKKNNVWYEFDDNSIYKVDTLNMSNAYCLFYKQHKNT